ncbi:MAG: hypothetical protein ACREUS_12365 [Burkholderiales bacterium]
MMRLLGLNIITVVLAAVLGQPPALAQTTAKDVSKKTAEAWDTLKAYTVDKKNDAVGYGRKLVRDTDRKIKELEGKAAKASGEVKAQYDREIKDLKARRAKASKKLDEMGTATGAAWDSAKDGFADAYRELHEAYDKAAAKFK